MPRCKKVCWKKVLVFIAVIFMTTLYYPKTFSYRRPSKFREASVNICCYYEDGGALPEFDYEFNIRQVESIYFHETSCRGGLNSRQACAVEAAARAHPRWQVHVLILSPVKNVTQPSFQALKMSSNVKLYRVHLLDYAEGTPFTRIILNEALNNTQWKISYTSDLMKYLTLFKRGGIYLDLDTIVMKNLGVLGMNWVVKDLFGRVGAGALAFSSNWLGRRVAIGSITKLIEIWREGDDWDNMGSKAIERVLQRICDNDDVSEMTAYNCKGFQVYDPEVFYPIDARNNNEYLKPQEKDYSMAYFHHVWNSEANNSFFFSLARKYCPHVYNEYNDDFGT